MTAQQAKDLGFTHEGVMFEHIPVYLKYFEDDGFEAVGRNNFYDFILDIFISIDQFFGIDKMFEIWEENKL